jgi:hypothetical protein
MAESLAISTESWVAALSVRVASVPALETCYDATGEVLWRRSQASDTFVTNDVAALAVVVLGTGDGATIGSLVAVTVLILGSVVLLLVLALLLLILILVVVPVLVLLLGFAVALAVPDVLFARAFEVCVFSFGMHITSVARVC